MIEGLLVQPLKQFQDERGKVMHMLRADSPHFTSFGEIYFSIINPGMIKAWKRHHKMTQNFAVPVGSISLVLYDNRESSSTFKEIIVVETGEENYQLIRIPPFIWYGFKCLSKVPALIANCSDLPHDPSESENIPLQNDIIPYKWEI